MFRLAERSKIPVSKIRQIFQQIPEIKLKREKEGLSPLIDLSIGQPHFPPNPEVMKLLEEMKPAQTSMGYSAAQGEPETLEAIVKLYKHYYSGVDYKNEETMVTLGGSGGLSNIFSILVEKKEDIILTFEPFFAAYTSQVQEWGGTLQKISTSHNHFRPDANELDKILEQSPSVKAIILNYPNNPSGVSLTHEEVTELATTLKKYPDVLIIIDDVYRDFNTLEHITVLDIDPELKDRCVVINSGAKGLLGAPGERIGMIAAHAELIRAMIPRQTNGLSSVPYRTQAALRFAVKCHLQNPENTWLMKAKEEYKSNVEIAFNAFSKENFDIPCRPDGAFYLLVSAKNLIGKINPHTFEEIKNDLDIANYFLTTAGVAVVPGSGFGIDPAEGCLRISCAKDANQIVEAAQRMGKSARLLQEKKSEYQYLSTISHFKSPVNSQLEIETKSFSVVNK